MILVRPRRSGRDRAGDWRPHVSRTSRLQVEHRPHSPAVLRSVCSTCHRAQPGEFRQHRVVRDCMDRFVRQSNDQGLPPLVSKVYGDPASAVRDRCAHQQFRQLCRCSTHFSVTPLLQPKKHMARRLLRRPGGGLQLPVRRPPIPDQHPGVHRGRQARIRARWGDRALRRRWSLRRMVRGVIRHDGSPESTRTPIVGPGVTAHGGDRLILHPYRLELTSATFWGRTSGRRGHRLIDRGLTPGRMRLLPWHFATAGGRAARTIRARSVRSSALPPCTGERHALESRTGKASINEQVRKSCPRAGGGVPTNHTQREPHRQLSPRRRGCSAVTGF